MSDLGLLQLLTRTRCLALSLIILISFGTRAKLAREFGLELLQTLRRSSAHMKPWPGSLRRLTRPFCPSHAISAGIVCCAVRGGGVSPLVDRLASSPWVCVIVNCHDLLHFSTRKRQRVEQGYGEPVGIRQLAELPEETERPVPAWFPAASAGGRLWHCPAC